jgi:hypothetical protein
MVDVAQYINEVKRDSEVLALLAKVQVRELSISTYPLHQRLSFVTQPHLVLRRRLSETDGLLNLPKYESKSR